MIEGETLPPSLVPSEIFEEERRWLELVELITEKMQDLLDPDNHSRSSLGFSHDALGFFLGMNLYMVRVLYEKIHDRFPHIKLETLMVEKEGYIISYTFLKGQTGYIRGARFIPLAEINNYLYEEFNLDSSFTSKDLNIKVCEDGLNENHAPISVPIAEDYNKVIEYCLGIFYAKEQEKQLLGSTKNGVVSNKNIPRL